MILIELSEKLCFSHFKNHMFYYKLLRFYYDKITIHFFDTKYLIYKRNKFIGMVYY